MQKRIILLLDGTWNNIDVGTCDTNIVRMRELISKHLVRTSHSRTHNDDGDKKVRGYTASGKEHIIFYERGVGTGAFDRFRGGAFGEGLSRNIRHAYKFLSFWYEPGDEVFIYGFSRGAYTARSLVGYLAAAGLLRRMGQRKNDSAQHNGKQNSRKSRQQSEGDLFQRMEIRWVYGNCALLDI